MCERTRRKPDSYHLLRSRLSGAHGYLIEDLCGNGIEIIGIEFDAGSLGINGAGVTGAEFRRVNGLKIAAGRFAQSTGTPIRFDASCLNVSIDRSVTFSSGTIDLNGMSRDRLDLSAWDQVWNSSAKTITGLLNANIAAGGSGAVIDMSANFPNFSHVGGIPPKAYSVLGVLRATTAATGSNVRFRFHHPDEIDANRMAQVQIAGFKNDIPYAVGSLIGADSNGDIEYTAQNTGGGTVTASLLVTGMHF